MMPPNNSNASQPTPNDPEQGTTSAGKHSIDAFGVADCSNLVWEPTPPERVEKLRRAWPYFFEQPGNP